jgi:Zn-dependent M28 family amino/carboxypeptidase
MDIPWERSSLARFQPSMSIADPSLNEMPGLEIAATVNPARADKLFAGTGRTFAEILAAAEANQPLPRFALKARLRAEVSLSESKAESENVVALLAGADPVLRNEYVVLSAHLDHVGVGEPIDGDRIYNGAMDNAAGVASLLEIARMMKESGAKPKRSIVFLAVTGEEKGLQGSRFYAKFPTANGTIVANINMDMFLPLYPLKLLEVQGLPESTLGDMIRAACERAGVTVQADKEPNRNLFIRSDQYSFIREGVPALAFKFGFEPGTPEEKMHKEWLKKRYHAPSDDLMQPVDKLGAAKFNRILMDLISQTANASERPRWKPDSFFKRFEKASSL